MSSFYSHPLGNERTVNVSSRGYGSSIEFRWSVVTYWRVHKCGQVHYSSHVLHATGCQIHESVKRKQAVFNVMPKSMRPESPMHCNSMIGDLLFYSPVMKRKTHRTHQYGLMVRMRLVSCDSTKLREFPQFIWGRISRGKKKVLELVPLHLSYLWCCGWRRV